MSQATIKNNIRVWTTVVEVWRRYSEVGAPLDLQDDVVTIVEQLEKYPRLNGAAGVMRAEITGGNDMVEIELKSGTLWAKWEINCEWTEEKAVTRAE